MIGSLTDIKSDRFGLKTILQIIIGVIIYFGGQFLAVMISNLYYLFSGRAPSFSTVAMDMSLPPLIVIGMILLRIAIPFLLICLYIVKILKVPLKDFRICKPKNIGVWILCALALPLTISAFYLLLVPGTFTTSELTAQQIKHLILFGVFGACLFAGISEELLFRGFIMRIFEVRWNKYITIIVPSVIFGLIHFTNMQNPNIVDFIQMLLGVTVTSIMLSMIAYQSGSFWASAIAHGLWNLIMGGGLLIIDLEPAPSIFTYTLKPNSILLTGGAFGIGSALPAVVGCGIVIFIAWFLQQRTAERTVD